MNSNRILFIGIGQCGNNIVNEFDARGYHTFAINTSDLDLKAIDIENKYRIPGATGCARDRKKALGYLRQNYNKIFNTIANKFSEQDMIYLVFSLGGGTGSGMSPLLLDAFSRKYYDKQFGCIVVVPSVDESIQCKMNAVEAYNELIKIPNLKSMFILDNNRRQNKLDINAEFVKLFDQVVNICEPNKNGVIDDYELEILLTCKGTSTILHFDYNEDKAIVTDADKSIFLEHEKNCQYLGVSTVNDFDVSVLEHEFGKPKDVFKGYNSKSNILIASGLPYPMKYFKQLDTDIQDFKFSGSKRLVNDVIDTSKYRELKVDVEKVKDFDFETLLENYK